MFCSKCGEEINDQAVVCVHCGCPVKNTNHDTYTSVTDAPTETDTGEKPTLASCAIIFAILIPIVGLILGIVGIIKYKSEKLKKKCIIAIPISIVVWIISFIILNL